MPWRRGAAWGRRVVPGPGRLGPCCMQPAGPAPPAKRRRAGRMHSRSLSLSLAALPTGGRDVGRAREGPLRMSRTPGWAGLGWGVRAFWPTLAPKAAELGICLCLQCPGSSCHSSRGLPSSVPRRCLCVPTPWGVGGCMRAGCGWQVCASGAPQVRSGHMQSPSELQPVLCCLRGL